MDKHNIFVAQIFRILALFSLLLPIPLTIRLIILYLTDFFDAPRFLLVGAKINSHTMFYQANDKIIDTLTYIIVFWYLRNHKVGGELIYILFGFLLLRIVGVYKLIASRNIGILEYYPDAFREISIYMAMIYDGYVTDKLIVNFIVIVLIVMFKMHFERIVHSNYLQINTPIISYRK